MAAPFTGFLGEMLRKRRLCRVFWWFGLQCGKPCQRAVVRLEAVGDAKDSRISFDQDVAFFKGMCREHRRVRFARSDAQEEFVADADFRPAHRNAFVRVAEGERNLSRLCRRQALLVLLLRLGLFGFSLALSITFSSFFGAILRHRRSSIVCSSSAAMRSMRTSTAG